jgi:hypothetical protein
MKTRVLFLLLHFFLALITIHGRVP